MSEPPSQTHAERWASAAETFRRFVPEFEPERTAASLARRLGPLGGFTFETVGVMWDRPRLSRRDRSLLVITTLAAQARDEELVTHTKIGVRHGLEAHEIVEILPHVAAIAGFPAAIAASRHVDEGLREALGTERLAPRDGVSAKGDTDRDADAASVWAMRTGGDPADATAARDAMMADRGDLGELEYRWRLGEIWSREVLAPRDRAIVSISALVTVGGVDDLAGEIGPALRVGLDETQIEEIVTHLGLYVGLPRAGRAMRVVRDAMR